MDLDMNLIFSVADQPRTGGKSIGTLNNSLNLLRHLARTPGLDRITPLANHTLDGLLPTEPHVHIRWHDAPTRGRLRRLWWDQVGLYAAARQAAGDWMFLPKGFTPLWGRPPCRLAVNVNDLMATYYKQHYPRGFPPVELAYFEQSLIATIRRAHLIVTISQFTADELARFADQHKLRLPRVLPIGIGFSPDDLPFRTNPPPPVEKRSGILALASAWPHKRTAMAIRLLEQWQQKRGFTEPVYWVGVLPPGVTLPGHANWQFVPRLTHDGYADKLGSVRALLYTSELEGFGMPPVEAALAGAWPVYSDLVVTREVMGSSPTAFVNDDVDSFVAAMDYALGHTTEDLAPWVAALRRQHHWPTIARRVVDALHAES
jgi:glycosyltransferase involved in cell wall biosynthesis